MAHFITDDLAPEDLAGQHSIINTKRPWYYTMLGNQF